MAREDMQPQSQSQKRDVTSMMEDQQRLQVIHEQRITQVEKQVLQQETRVTVIEANQGRLEAVMNKLADVMTVQATKTTLNEAAIAVMRDGLALHSRNIEDMKTEQVSSGNLLVEFKTQMGFMKTFGGTSLAIVAGITISVLSVLISHFIHF